MRMRAGCGVRGSGTDRQSVPKGLRRSSRTYRPVPALARRLGNPTYRPTLGLAVLTFSVAAEQRQLRVISSEP
jgi:hypothetical protein